jgi:SAM-dependent methyltransferase
MNPLPPRSGRRPDYGLDAPYVVRNLAILGLVSCALGIMGYFVLRDSRPAWAAVLLNTLGWPGLSWLLTIGLMVWGSRRGKLGVRDRLMNQLDMRGDERVLDVGCGHGLLLIGAAKRLTTGKAVGIDIWQAKDQADNRPDATRTNAEIEGVSDRVEIFDADARRLPFSDETFDLIVSSWALHNIPNAEGRSQALREIIRLLRPGGRVAILDIWYTRAHIRMLRASGFPEARRSIASFCFLWPTFLVLAQKQPG